MNFKNRLNKEDPQIMWVDLNSAFATAEQQAHPCLRGRPMGVTNRLSKECCVIAASYEAKALGIKVGTRRSEALAICPDFVMVESDPPKYHHIYKCLFRILQDYAPKIKMKSIDEAVLDFHGTYGIRNGRSLEDIGYEIKRRVREEIGDYMRVNVGIGPNWFLAKTAAGLNKPDGLDRIDHRNVLDVYKKMELQDLTGIADGYGSRLRAYSINTPMDFYNASLELLQKNVFKGINGYYWWLRLRGFEIDDNKTTARMVGRQWVVKNPSNDEEYLRSCLHFLVETTGMKLRYRNFAARGVCVWLSFQAGGGFVDKRMYKVPVYRTQDIWQRVTRIFDRRPKHMVVRTMGVYVYQLEHSEYSQLSMFDDVARADYLTKAIDEINDFYGSFTVFSADTLMGTKVVKQKIPFGGTEYFDLLLKRQ